MDDHCIQWCLRRLDMAIADFDINGIKDYTEMLKLWLRRLNEVPQE